MEELPKYAPYFACASRGLSELKGFDWTADLSTLVMETNIQAKRNIDGIEVIKGPGIKKPSLLNLRFSIPTYKEGYSVWSQPIYGRIMGMTASKDLLGDAVQEGMIDKVAYAIQNRLYVDLFSDLFKEGYSPGYFIPLPWNLKEGEVAPYETMEDCVSAFLDSSEGVEEQLASAILGVEMPVYLGGNGILDSTSKALELGQETRKRLDALKDKFPEINEVAIRFGINYSYVKSGKEANLASFIAGLHEETGLNASYHAIPPQFVALTAALGESYVAPEPSNYPTMTKFVGSNKGPRTKKPFLNPRLLRFESLEKDPTTGLYNPAHNCAYCRLIKSQKVVTTFVNDDFKRAHFHEVMLEQVALIREARRNGEDLREVLRNIYAMSGYKNILEPIIKTLNAGYW